MGASVKSLAIVVTMTLIVISFIIPLATVHAQTFNSGPIGIGNLTAKIIATTGEYITGQVNATGYTFGIYIGPGINNVMIYRAHIFGASDHGILAIDTYGISVIDSNISGNVLHPVPSIPDHKEIGFYGVSDSYIVGNRITDARGDGGISVYSSSSLVPTGLPIPNINSSGDNNFIADNFISNDSQGCGIVVAAWGPGQTVANNWIFNNVVMGSIMTPHGPTGFNVGTIVVAADFPFSVAKNNVVLDNTVIGGLEDGIIINAQAPGSADISNEIIGNFVEFGGFQRINNPPFDNASDLNLAPAPNAIAIYANYIPQTSSPIPPIAQYNIVIGNTLANDVIGIWVANAYNGTYMGNSFQNITVPFESFYGVG